MIARPFDAHVLLRETTKRIAQCGAIRVANRDVIQAGRARGRRIAARALPRIETNVVVIPPGTQKRRARPPRDHIETQHAAVERDRPIEISDFEVYVPDVNPRIDAFGHTSMIPQTGTCREPRVPQPCSW